MTEKNNPTQNTPDPVPEEDSSPTPDLPAVTEEPATPEPIETKPAPIEESTSAEEIPAKEPVKTIADEENIESEKPTPLLLKMTEASEQIKIEDDKPVVPPHSTDSASSPQASSPQSDSRQAVTPASPPKPESIAPSPLQGEGGGEVINKVKAPIIIAPDSVKPAVRQVLGFMVKLNLLRSQANQARSEKKDNNLKIILQYAREHNRVDNKAVRKLTGVKDERARQYLDLLEKQGNLTQFNTDGPGVFYMPTHKQ